MCSDSCLLWEHGRQPEVSSYFCLNSRSRWFKERTARGKSVIPLSLFTTYVSGKLDRRSERQIVISGDNHSPPPGSTISMCHLLPTCFVCDFTEDISHAHWLTEPLIHTLINVSCQHGGFHVSDGVIICFFVFVSCPVQWHYMELEHLIKSVNIHAMGRLCLIYP